MMEKGGCIAPALHSVLILLFDSRNRSYAILFTARAMRETFLAEVFL